LSEKSKKNKFLETPYLINAAYQIAFTEAQQAYVNTKNMRYRFGIGYLF
jgi:hypothetical protein